jgi:hypothetical protein
MKRRDTTTRALAILLGLALLVAACGPAPTPQGQTPEPAPVLPTPAPTDDWATSPLPPPVEGLPPGAMPAEGQVPADLLDQILADLAGRLGLSAEQIAVLRAEAVIWSDGSLGCPRPGEMYTQALTDGYWLLLQAGGQPYSYHADASGYFLLCEDQASGRLPGGDAQPVTGEVPADLLDEIRADLAQRLGVGREAITVARAEAVTWSDGSLGCPQPGVMYTQALVEGYWVVLEAGGVQYDYRVGERGSFSLCRGPASGGGLPASGAEPIQP